MESAILDGLLPIVDAAQGLARTSVGLCIGTLLCIFALHLLGVLTLQLIRTRRVFIVRYAYLIHGVRFAPKERYDSPEPPRALDRTFETDDTDCTAPPSPCAPSVRSAASSLYPKTLHMPPGSSSLSSSGQLRGDMTASKSSKSLTDVGFSETKV
jgi:hypothetical protein